MARLPLLRYQEEANGIFSFHLFNKRFCRSVLDHVSVFGTWETAAVRKVTRNGVLYTAKRPRVRSAHWWCDPDESKIYSRFDKAINGCIKPFVERIWQIESKEHSGTQIVRYGPGGHYVPHSDAGLDNEDRFFTVVCYLNDDFHGGKTRFLYLDYSVTPEAGKVILFPSKYTHQAEPVLSGDKYVFITWLVGPPPIKWL